MLCDATLRRMAQSYEVRSVNKKLLVLWWCVVTMVTMCVLTGLFSLSGTEGRGISLVCGNESKVVWEKGADGGRSSILTAEGGAITQKLRADPGNRYRVMSDLSLWIVNLSLSDSGIYYCNNVSVVDLTVYPAPPAGSTASPQPPLPTPTPPPTTGTSDITEHRKTCLHHNFTTTITNTITNNRSGILDLEPDPLSVVTVGPIKIALAVLAAVLLIVTALLLLRCYSRRKAAEARTPDHVYETANGTAPTTQPGGNEYEFDSDPSGSIYSLSDI
ncbi:hypothetical protein NFI96_025298 [Prochilodus magdalenae]|nr:hypothetical protein NFI96_025298 [Prochilodus magdalenae]